MHAWQTFQAGRPHIVARHQHAAHLACGLVGGRERYWSLEAARQRGLPQQGGLNAGRQCHGWPRYRGGAMGRRCGRAGAGDDGRLHDRGVHLPACIGRPEERLAQDRLLAHSLWSIGRQHGHETWHAGWWRRSETGRGGGEGGDECMHATEDHSWDKRLAKPSLPTTTCRCRTITCAVHPPCTARAQAHSDTKA